MNHNKYESPLSSRYASQEMQYIFSPDKKFSTWHRLWIALARAEMELGLKNEDGTPTITQNMIDEMEAHIEDIDYQAAAEEERNRMGKVYRVLGVTVGGFLIVLLF